MSRVQLTQEQYKLLLQGRGSPDTAAPAVEDRTARPGVKRSRRSKAEMPENVVEGQIKSFLEARGWLCIRRQVGTFAALGILLATLDKGQPITRELLYRNLVRIGQKGDADWIAVRRKAVQEGQVFNPALCDFLFWEAKAPGKKPGPDQLDFIRRMTAAGFEAKWFDSFNGGGDSTFLLWFTPRYGQ